MSPSKPQLEEIIDRALAEDVGKGDVTTEALLLDNQAAVGFAVVRKEGILAGTGAAKQVFQRVDSKSKVEILVEDGSRVEPGREVIKVSGTTAGILKAERVALNFLQRLSGIATLTRQYVEKVAGTGVKILDTRKTTPGLRYLEKYSYFNTLFTQTCWNISLHAHNSNPSWNILFHFSNHFSCLF